MNLHQLVSGGIGVVNPFVMGQIRLSTGSTTAPDGSRVPTYLDHLDVPMQIQSLQYTDLLKLGALNIQGVRNKIYVNGDWSGLIRATGKGGDLIVVGGHTWLVAIALESWPDWVCLAVTLQDDV